MIFGNWIAISKHFVRHLPDDRAYTPLEAMFSITVDADNSKLVSVAGYSKLWKWSRNKVNLFLEKNGIEIIYPESTASKKNQRGEIKGHIRDITWTDNGHTRFILDAALYPSKDIKRTNKGHKKDITIYPDPNPNKESIVWVVDYLNRKAGTNYKASSKKTASLINSRIKDGFNGEDFKKVIDIKTEEWKGSEMEKYLRPETLFGTKFEGYLNQKKETQGSTPSWL